MKYSYKVVFHNRQEVRMRVVYFETLQLATLFCSYLFVKHGIVAKVRMI